jgi:hypothetical protein
MSPSKPILSTTPRLDWASAGPAAAAAVKAMPISMNDRLFVIGDLLSVRERSG